MKQTNSNLLRLVEKALAQCGHHSAEISIKLSPSRQLANVRAGKKRFSVLLSERPEQEILNSTGFVLTEDAIDTVRACRVRYILFHSSTMGIVTIAKAIPGSNTHELRDEFGCRVWVVIPIGGYVRI